MRDQRAGDGVGSEERALLADLEQALAKANSLSIVPASMKFFE